MNTTTLLKKLNSSILKQLQPNVCVNARNYNKRLNYKVEMSAPLAQLRPSASQKLFRATRRRN